jgi:hypothetical protein
VRSEVCSDRNTKDKTRFFSELFFCILQMEVGMESLCYPTGRFMLFALLHALHE